MRFELTDDAERDLLWAYVEGAERFGVAQAQRYQDKLYDLFELLAANPRIGRELTRVTPPVRVHPHAAHVVVYETRNEAVVILRVRHGREDWLGALSP